jgi:phage terminase small subunit
MGARGPKPAAGSDITHLSVVTATRLPPPKRLLPAAAAVWRETVDSKPAGFFEEADTPILESYAMQIAIYREAYAALYATPPAPVAAPQTHALGALGTAAPATAEQPPKTSLLIQTPNGYTVENRLLAIMTEAQRMTAALAVKLRLNANAKEKPEKGRKAPAGGSGREGLMFTG